ncbi:hypothetical protein AKJ57_06145 [candidate division MSBL1 archaeon SCGC-AAA259A05]|uniref:Probable transcription termination protein NusA n=1 Tax=candidate division MSBL1 archaeon SCGC-AAA259A05 TaxID=1698259 RepID=A0A133U3Z5_9EURY|nr:hypothetical protein AKJ57_06145 [candidate division MSBL1 archaeon SCGC-AAA259A05]
MSSMKINLSNEELRYISLFEELTGVTPRDFVESGGGSIYTFVVDEGDMGKAIGKNGRNIRRVRKKIDETVNVVEYSDDPEKFLENIFSSVEIRDIEIVENEGEKIAVVDVKESEKGKAVGRNGWNIERARKLSSRHHGLAEVSFA